METTLVMLGIGFKFGMYVLGVVSFTILISYWYKFIKHVATIK